MIVEPIKDIAVLNQIKRVIGRHSKRDLLIFTLGLNSGLRISDILSLNVGDVRHKTHISIIEKKTGKFKKIFINSKVKQMINIFIRNKKDSEPLFLTRFHNRVERTYVYRMLKAVCKKAGLEINVGTHTIRKTFGYHHYSKYKDIAILQKIFNHSSPTITLRYIGIDQDRIDQSYCNFIL